MAKQNTDADVDFIKALAELLNENDLTELEVKREYGDADKLNVRVSRAKQIIQHAAAPMAAAPAPSATATLELADRIGLKRLDERHVRCWCAI